MPEDPCLQERFAPQGACFGCGPANPRGLRIRSFASAADAAWAEWRPEKHHEAFEGVLCGGVIGTLLDCHLNWTAAWHLMGRTAAASPPCTVTARYAVELRRPTPTDGLVRLEARVVSALDDRAEVEGSLVAAGKICATCTGTFVAVKPGHPAWHRW